MIDLSGAWLGAKQKQRPLFADDGVTILTYLDLPDEVWRVFPPKTTIVYAIAEHQIWLVKIQVTLRRCNKLHDFLIHSLKKPLCSRS